MSDGITIKNKKISPRSSFFVPISHFVFGLCLPKETINYVDDSAVSIDLSPSSSVVLSSGLWFWLVEVQMW